MKLVPVIHFELSLKKKLIELITSLYSPIPKECFFSISDIKCFGNFSFILLKILDSSIPAEIQLILIFFLANSDESDFDKLTCEIFDDE